MESDTIILKVLNDITKTIKIKDKEGKVIGTKEKVIKRNVISRLTANRWDLRVADYITEKGKPAKTKCFIKDTKTSNTYLVSGGFEKWKKIIEIQDSSIVVKGFRK